MRALAAGGFADLASEFSKVGGCLVERVPAFEFGAKRDLQKLRCWKPASLQLIMQIIGQIHLKAGHTPHHTPMPHALQQRRQLQPWLHPR
jgi:hypothetical protein